MSERSLPHPFPRVLVCPQHRPGQQRRQEVESQLPVMSDLWDTWDQVTAGRHTSADLLPWRNETGEMRQLLGRVMYEGARLAAPHCQDLLSDCLSVKHHKIFTEKGLCLEISAGRETILLKQV